MDSVPVYVLYLLEDINIFFLECFVLTLYFFDIFVFRLKNRVQRFFEYIKLVFGQVLVDIKPWHHRLLRFLLFIFDFVCISAISTVDIGPAASFCSSGSS
jgi:hypothetical protein